MKIQFTPEDIQFMQARGSNPEDVQRQFSFFEKGFDFVNLDTLYSTIASYRSEKGRYGQKVEDLRKNKPVLGLISLIGLWTSQQRQIQKDTKSVALMSLERAVASIAARKSTML